MQSYFLIWQRWQKNAFQETDARKFVFSNRIVDRQLLCTKTVLPVLTLQIES